MDNDPDFFNPIQYSILKKLNLIRPFNGIENIQINHSQLHQDMFVLCALDGLRNGTYLEIGAHEPIFISNTYLLESVFNWRGVSIELDPEMAQRHKSMRSNICCQADALQIDYEKLLSEQNLPPVIDYLSVDIDPPCNSLSALRKIPHHQYRFKIITFEHDYSHGGKLERIESRLFLESLGYKLVVSDVSWGNRIIEDWWAHPDHTHKEIISALTRNSTQPHDHANYIYGHENIAQTAKQPCSIPLNPDQTSLCIEGWRGINHSYCLVNQWQLINLIKYPLQIRHKDMHYWDPGWGEATDNGSGFLKQQYEPIMAIPAPIKGERFDVTYRIAFPYNISECNSAKLFIFGTSEFGHCHGMFAGADLSEACQRDNLKIITPSNWSRQGFLASGFRESAVEVVSHGIDPASFYSVESELRDLYREVIGLAPGEFALLFVGSLTTNKGFDLLLQAYCKLKPDFPGLRLVVKYQYNLYGISADDWINLLAGNASSNGFDAKYCDDIIKIPDNFDIDSMRALYNACDAYVSPYKGEGFNLPPLEAAACGLPIIVTGGGSTDDYFDPIMGLQIRAKRVQENHNLGLEPDLDSLVESIEAIMSTPNRWGGLEASRKVHRDFNWAKVTDQLVQVLGLG
jgi:glycosyltransferase involved in cell wall biosynthesis